MSTFTALVLAASRGPDDPVARHAGQPNKVFVSVHGRPMLAWVIDTLKESSMVGRIAVSINDPKWLDTVPELSAAVSDGSLQVLQAGGSPSDSVAHALQVLEAPFPVLVTTADHPLLTPEMIEHFCGGLPVGCDVAVGVARAEVVNRSYPGAVRTYYRFADGGVSGCNLYALRSPAALRAVAFWSQIERYRKRPWRLMLAIGPITVVRLLLGTLTLEAALQRLSGLIGVTARVVELPFAEAAIDVDKPGDLTLAEAILKRRRVVGD